MDDTTEEVTFELDVGQWNLLEEIALQKDKKFSTIV